MKTLVVHKAVYGLDEGEYTFTQLEEKEVQLRDVAQMVARGRAEWRHGESETGQPEVKNSAAKKVTNKAQANE